MERYYRFAGIDLMISMDENRFYAEEYRLTPFRVNTVTNPEKFYFDIVDELKASEGICIVDEADFRIYRNGIKSIRYIGPKNNAYIRIISEGHYHLVQLQSQRFPGRIGTKTVLDAIAAEHLIAQAGGFIFHCSYINRQGKAILFTAPSETGKSTQAELWKKYRGVEIINGDRAAVQIVNGAVFAEGIPFSGSSQYCRNCSLPVEAIVYLGQASATSIRQMHGYEIFARIWEGLSVNIWDRTDVEMVSSTVQTIAETVPVFYLSCTPDESAIIALERAIEGR